MENENFKFRPGLEYNCYLPRLSGAEAIPTLTPKKYRGSCSSRCSHPWKPREPPRIPTPPPPDPVDVYRRRYLSEQIDDWEYEIEKLETKINQINSVDSQGPNWSNARAGQERIQQINRCTQKITQKYTECLFGAINTVQGIIPFLFKQYFFLTQFPNSVFREKRDTRQGRGRKDRNPQRAEKRNELAGGDFDRPAHVRKHWNGSG